MDKLYDTINCVFTDTYCVAYPVVVTRRKKVHEVKPYMDSVLKRPTSYQRVIFTLSENDAHFK